MSDQNSDIEWKYSTELVPYEEAMELMEARVQQIHLGTEKELIWFLEHPPLYTAGTSAEEKDLLTPDRFPVYKVGRGGQYTYHGPGQRVVYVMLNLNKRGKDVRKYVQNLEQWVIDSLKEFNVVGERREGRVGVWVEREVPSFAGVQIKEEKIAAIGVRVRKWITFHGICINVHPDLSHYTGIVPCGINEHGVTSLKNLHIDATLSDLDQILKQQWLKIFSEQ